MKKNSNNKSSANLKGWNTKKGVKNGQSQIRWTGIQDVDNDSWFEPNFTFFSEMLKVAEHSLSDIVSLQFQIQFGFHSFSVAC